MLELTHDHGHSKKLDKSSSHGHWHSYAPKASTHSHGNSYSQVDPPPLDTESHGHSHQHSVPPAHDLEDAAMDYIIKHTVDLAVVHNTHVGHVDAEEEGPNSNQWVLGKYIDFQDHTIDEHFNLESIL